MIYILGVNHNIQWDLTNPNHKDINKYLENFIVKHGITVLAEEYHKDFLPENQKTSVLKKIANRKNIKHIYCDANEEERERLGIKTPRQIRTELNIPHSWSSDKELYYNGLIDGELKKFFGKREKFWINKIKKYFNQNIIFVCGYKHKKTLSGRLKRNGCDVIVIRKRKFNSY